MTRGYKIPKTRRDAVIARDGMLCAKCHCTTILQDEMDARLVLDTTRYDDDGGPIYTCNDQDFVKAFNRRRFTLDHIIPKSRGGKHGLDNLQILCAPCNSKKGNRT